MQKKGQLTLFFVLGLFLLVSIFVISQFSKQQVAVERITTSSASEISLFVESCLEQVGEDAIYHVMLQGGYYVPPINSVSFLEAEIATYWKDQVNLLPEKNEIEQELATYITFNLHECVNEFEPLTEKGYFVATDSSILKSLEQLEQEEVDESVFIEEEEYYEPFFDDTIPIEDEDDTSEFVDDFEEVAVTITDQSVTFALHAPLTIEKDSSSQTVNDFFVSLPIDLNKPYELASQILQVQEESPDFLPIGYITALAYDNDFSFETIEVDDSTVVISLLFNVPDKDTLIYSFGQEYNWY